jgi:dihydrofolate reductase
MGKVRFQISVSLDGYVAGPNMSEDDPLGEGGERLHDWFVPLKAFKERHGGGSEGEVNASTPVAEEQFRNVGATIMGRGMFGPVAGGPWGEDPWRGWWGDDPPFHHPVFVLTHHPREPLEMDGGTTFHFVTDGIEAALDRAREAAAGGDVAIGGGAATIDQYLAAGLVDEMNLSVVPIFLRGGARLFDDLGDASIALEQVRAIDAPGVTHVSYRVRR